MKSKQNKYTVLSIKIATTAVVLFFASPFLFHRTANAGIISIVGSLFKGEQVSAKTSQPASVINSQTINLLQAHTNINPTSDVLADTTPISNNEVLIADIALTNSGAEDTSNTQVSLYTVQTGDTTSGIAKMFHVSTNTILWANNLTGKSALKVGQTLVILPVTGISYTVKSGDTVQSIANKYKADINDVYSYNDILSSSKLIIGQKLIIPDAEILVVASNPSVKVSAYDNRPRNTDGPYYPDYYIRPIIGGTKTQGLHGNNSIDLASALGTPIYAAAGGKVIVSVMGGWHGGYGNYIIISHPNGTQTVYAHLQKTVVGVGDDVDRGQKIALMGSTGNSTGPHVHFEIRGAKNPF